MEGGREGGREGGMSLSGIKSEHGSDGKFLTRKVEEGAKGGREGGREGGKEGTERGREGGRAHLWSST